MGGGTRAIENVMYQTRDDGHWNRGTTWNLPSPPIDLRLRRPLTISSAEFEDTAGLYVSAMAECEVFWDGQRIGTTRMIDSFFPLTADQTATGTHLLEINVRAKSLPAGMNLWFYAIGLGDYAHMVRSRGAAQVVPMIATGMFLVVAIGSFVMWASQRRRVSLLVFSMLSVAAALLAVAEGYRPLFGYPFEWHVVRLRVIAILTFAISASLPLYLALELRQRNALLRVAAFLPLLAMAWMTSTSYDGACIAMFSLSMLSSSTVIAGAISRIGWRVLPSGAGVAILSGSLAAGAYRFADRTFFVAFAALVACFLISSLLELRRERREHEAARTRAARLEIELLKKSIQPHFVMNTLTAVMEWMEENPRDGVRFLQSLADELRIFIDIARDSLIPVERELELCRAHLRIMSCRMGSRFELDADGLKTDDRVPPAIFHTLVENAISHNAYGDEPVAFQLREEREHGSRRYLFSAPIRGARPTPAACAGEVARAPLGTRYLTARLEESYPGRWRLRSFADGDRWQTLIEVPA